MFSETESARYCRQMLSACFGVEGQRRLKNASVLVVGLGGLGSPVALYLAAAGVGTLLIADGDCVSADNLNRQILYRTRDLGGSKAKIAARRLRAANPFVRTIFYDKFLAGDALAGAVKKTDVILDCSDNMATRHAINAACVAGGKTLVSGSVVGFDGQLLVVAPPYAHGCFACVFPERTEPARTGKTAGVVGPAAGVIASLQALETLKILAGIPSALCRQMRLFDGRTLNTTTLERRRDAHCPVCGKFFKNENHD